MLALGRERSDLAMKRTYATLLRLYPYDYRSWFGTEMRRAFEETARDRLAPGRWAWMRFALVELIGLITGAGGEWFAKLTTSKSVRGRCLPDLRMMRPAGVTREMWFARAGENRE
jgi:hypothetical protein